jgi:hypothetical protein
MSFTYNKKRGLINYLIALINYKLKYLDLNNKNFKDNKNFVINIKLT